MTDLNLYKIISRLCLPSLSNPTELLKKIDFEVRKMEFFANSDCYRMRNRIRQSLNDFQSAINSNSHMQTPCSHKAFINIRLSNEGELYIAEYQRAVGEPDISRYIEILGLITLLRNDENGGANLSK